MTDDTTTTTPPFPTLEDWQHWTWVTGRAQQMLMETWAESLQERRAGRRPGRAGADRPDGVDDRRGRGLVEGARGVGQDARRDRRGGTDKDRRFASPEWSRKSGVRHDQAMLSRHFRPLLGSVEEIEGIDDEARQKLRFATKSFVDAMAPSNFALTNPDVMKKTIETRGENLLGGPRNMLDDIRGGQLTQTAQGRVRGRAQPRRDAGQGDLRE